MSTAAKFIGLDIGAESGRCFVAILNNSVLELDELYRFTTHSIRTDTEFRWDINAIINEIIKGLSKASDKYGPDFNGIGIDTWGVDYVITGPDGKPLDNPFHYRDHRTDEMIEKSISVMPVESLYNITGNVPAQYNTLFQLLAEKPESLSNSGCKLLLMPDYIKYALTGIAKSEYTIASTTNLIDAQSKTWSDELMDTFNIPKSIFTDITEPGSILGNIIPEISKITGLSESTPVISTPGHDTACAVASIPADEKNFTFLSSGTWSIMGMELANPVITEEALNNGFNNEGGFGNTIRFLKNIIGMWPLQECKRIWDESGSGTSYKNLVNSAIEYGQADLFINLNENKFLGSCNMPELIKEFLPDIKKDNYNNRGFITRVILESLALTYRDTINSLRRTTGIEIDKLYAVGGGIKNDLLNQLTTDATGLELIAGPVEGTIAGNIGIQAIATEIVPDIKRWREVVRDSFELKRYNPENP